MVSKKSKMVDERDMSFSSSMAIIDKLNALKQNISGGSSHDKPAELFRKDLISAMKLPDSEALRREDYCLISDHWRQDWEKGVQVPVNPDAMKVCQVNYIKENEQLNGPYIFKLPKKLLHAVADETYRQGAHELHETQKLADEVCRYDLDELDVTWLSDYNCLRLQHGDSPLTEYEMERIMEALETRCYDGMQEAMKSVGLVGIEYDEDVVCDICRSPESEDGNEMIFCDACDVCVHQACYGVHKIPAGSWLCRPCALGIKPQCVLCPNSGGAMKSTHDGSQWAHLSCALWIPEIAIVDTEKMEPIDKICDIPANRWALICTLCRERTGACIQCSVKKCKTAFHVTCAFMDNLEMKINFDEESELVLKGYCTKHSRKRDSVDGSPKKTPVSTPKKHSEMTEEEKKAEKTRKIQQLAEEFYTYVGELKQVAEVMDIDMDTLDIIYNYWLLKRKSNFNRPLMTPKVEEGDLLLKQREDGMIARLKMFIHLRQDLERVRNLCYMVSRREKMRNQFVDVRRSIFMQQVAILRSQAGRCLGARDYKSVVTAHLQSTSVYDRPDEIMRKAKMIEPSSTEQEGDAPVDAAASSAADSENATLPKVSRIGGRGRGRPPGTSNTSKNVGNNSKTAAVTPRPRSTPSTENPYARPTYKSFAWMISSRRRSSAAAANTSTPADASTPTSAAESAGRRRRRDFHGGANSSSTAAVDSPSIRPRATLSTSEILNNNVCVVLNPLEPSEVKSFDGTFGRRRRKVDTLTTTTAPLDAVTVVKDDSAQSLIDVGTDEKVSVDVAVNAITVPSSSVTPADSMSSEFNHDASGVAECVKSESPSSDFVGQTPESAVDVEDVTVSRLNRDRANASHRATSPVCVVNGPGGAIHLNGCFSLIKRAEDQTGAGVERRSDVSGDSASAKVHTRHFSDVLLTQSPPSSREKPEGDETAAMDVSSGVDAQVTSVNNISPSKQAGSARSRSGVVATANGITRHRHSDVAQRGAKRGENNRKSSVKSAEKSSDKLRQKTLDCFFRQPKSAADSLVNGHVDVDSTTTNLNTSDGTDDSTLNRRLSLRPARKRLRLDDVKKTTASVRSGDSDSCDFLFGRDVDNCIVDDANWNRRSSLRSSLALVNSR